MVPHVGPAQPPPERAHVTDVTAALLTVAVNCCVSPTCTFAVDGCRSTLTAGGGVIVTVVDAVTAASAAEMALTVTVAGFGTAAGAVNRPESLIVPVAGAPPVTLSTCQVTAVLPEFATVAVNCRLLPVCTDGLAGAMLTVIAGGPSSSSLFLLEPKGQQPASSVDMASVMPSVSPWRNPVRERSARVEIWLGIFLSPCVSCSSPCHLGNPRCRAHDDGT